MYICQLFKDRTFLKFQSRKYVLSTLVLFGLGIGLTQAQTNTIGLNELGGGNRLNTITTAVPFLIISPDSRAGAMGDLGAATTPDVNSIHWNASKLVRVDKDMGFGMSYTPWLRQLVPDISISYLSGFKKVKEFTVVGGSLRYFSLGDIIFTDQFGNEIRPFRPNEFSIDAFVGTRLSEFISGAVTFRYVNSNLTGGIPVQGASTKPGRTVSADLSAYYEKPDMKIAGKDAELAIGIVVSNIGGKISYSNTSKTDFLPMNLRLGPRVTFKLDDYNSISWAVDFNKLLVPTPPIYKVDPITREILSTEDGLVIGAGKNPDRPVASGLFGSFSDAPGTPLLDDNGDFIENPDGTYQIQKNSRFKEEMREINFATGLEYWYDNQFAFRTGYFWEHALKGNRKYFTLGAGLRYNVFGLDFAYLIPAYFGNTVQQSPLQNTLRFTLTFDFDAFKKQNKEATEEGDS